MNEDHKLYSLEELLPTIHVDPSVLRHVRTLFYSSTRNHQHLANLSVTQTQDPPTLTITAMLPIASAINSTHPLLSPSFRPNTVLTLPLVSNLTGTPPPSRRPTHNLNSLIALFPPSATCQSSPLLQLHLTLPSVRHRLTVPSPISSSSVSLSQTSLTILLTTGQSSEIAGLLLTNRRGTAQSAGREVLQPAPFSASGDVAGVWVRGDDKATATLALHALAAAWWTRRNRRLPRNPNDVQFPSGDWYERRFRFLQFPTSGGNPTIQTGVIAIRDDMGVRYTADISDSCSPVTFVASGSTRRDASSDTSTTTGKQNIDDVLGDGWRGGWVPAVTERELQNARNARILHKGNRDDENAVGASLGRESRPRRRTRSRHGSPTLSQPRPDSSSPLRHHSPQMEDSSSMSADKIDFGGRPDGRKYDGESLWLTERMRPLCFTRRDDIAEAGSKGCNDVQNNPRNDTRNGDDGGNEQMCNAAPVRIIYRNVDILSDSDGELGNEDSEVDMEQLCRKYLHNGYHQEIRRHRVRPLGNRGRHLSNED